MSRWKFKSLRSAAWCSDGYPQKAFPAAPAVYVVFVQEHPWDCFQIKYIGSSQSLFKRIASYCEKWTKISPAKIFFKTSRFQGSFYNIKIKYRVAKKLGEHLMAEYRLISRIAPAWNVNRGSARIEGKSWRR